MSAPDYQPRQAARSAPVARAGGGHQIRTKSVRHVTAPVGEGKKFGPFRSKTTRPRTRRFFPLPQFFVKAVKGHAKAAYRYKPYPMGLTAEFQALDVLKLKLKTC